MSLLVCFCLGNLTVSRDISVDSEPVFEGSVLGCGRAEVHVSVIWS